MTSIYEPGGRSPLEFHKNRPMFADGRDTPRAYLERCLEVIDAREPVVNGWVILNAEGARDQADASAQRWRDGCPLSQIDGMPIGIKDLLETRDMPTQMGCDAYEGHFPRRDNAAVWALREAGAVIIGKTVTAELGGAQPGPTTNPFNPDHTPGGSSSGSAAAVGAGMVPAAIGSQVGGSIVRPASYCGAYALKPTQGAINRGEAQGLSMCTHGPLAGSLEDMWSVAIEIATRAGGDPGCEALFGPKILPDARRPLVLAVMETEGWDVLDDASRSAFEQVIAQIRAAGVVVLGRQDDPELERFESMLVGVRHLTLNMTIWENQWDLRNLLAQNPDGVSQRGRGALEIAERSSVEDYQAMLRCRALVRSQFALFANRIDALIAPASAGPAPARVPDATGDPTVAIPTGDPVFNTPSSLLGAPVVTSPLVAVGGLPMGIQIMGQPGTDARVTSIARWLRDAVAPVIVGRG